VTADIWSAVERKEPAQSLVAGREQEGLSGGTATREFKSDGEGRATGDGVIRAEQGLALWA